MGYASGLVKEAMAQRIPLAIPRTVASGMSTDALTNRWRQQGLQL